MSQNVIQHSFAAGEISPSLYARTDLDKYKSGAAVMRNFFVDYRSGASNRTGTKFVIQALQSSTAVRLIPFQYSIIRTYVLEFGDHYIRFITNGGAVLEDAFAISAASNGTPGQITAIGNNFVNNDWVFVDSIVGATTYNGRFYTVQVSGNVLTMFDVNGNPVDASAFGTYLSGGTVARVFKLASPYAAEDLALLKYTQSASVLTLTHPDYIPYNLATTGPLAWTLTAISFGTTISAPTGGSAAATTGTGAYFAYVVTSVDSNGQESLPSSPIKADNVVNLTTTAGTITVTWVAATNAVSYNVYKASLSVAATIPAGAAYGFVGSCTGTTFIDSNIVPDFVTTPQVNFNPFASSNNPAVSCYFQQRQVFASSIDEPMTFWMSQPGAFNNFNLTNPVQADNSVTGTLVSDEVNEIKSLKPMPGGLIALTAKGAWQISGGQAGAAITPATATAVPQAYNGASDLPPIVVNYDVIYVQAKGSSVRDLSYNIYVNIYTGTDISLLSNHLFTDKQLIQWAYAEEPFKIIWAVRDDGALLSLTFLKEQEVYGWARHDTQGQFKSIASVVEDNAGGLGQVQDVVYVVVKRFIDGLWVQYIERFAERQFPYGVEDAWVVDAGATSDLPTPAASLTISASSGTANFTASAGVFASTDVDSVIRAGGGIATVTSYISPTQVQALIAQDITDTIPNDPNEVPLPVAEGAWSLTTPFTVFSGLDHLEGCTVSILADGGVVTPQVVVNGQITLPQAVTKVTAGLAFTCQLQTLRLDVGEPTIQGKRKSISAVTVRCANTRGIWIGSNFDSNILVPAKELYSTTPLNVPSPLITGDERIITDPLWDTEGQIAIQITDPLPATILGVIPEIQIGDTDEGAKRKR